MGSVLVVMLDLIVHETFELVLVPDDCVVEEFSADRSDPSFGEGVGHGCADGGLEDLEALGSKDLVEGVDELGAAVSDQRPGVGELVGVAPEQVAGGLSSPGAGRVRGHPQRRRLVGWARG